MNKPIHGVVRALPAIVLLAAAGCNILAPQQERSRFFILTSVSDVAPPGASALAPGRDVSVGVGPVKFPEYLKRPEIVTRVGADQLELSEDKRWAEPLDSNFQRVLGENLSQMLGTQRIVMFPWYGKIHVDYQVEVQVRRFDTSSDGTSQLTAKWIIRDGKNGTELFATDTTTSSPAAGGDSSGAAALSRDLSALSRQIAERIAELHQARRAEKQ